MLEHIEKLRGKSEGEKRRFVFLFSAGVTLVIASFWMFGLVFRIGNGTLSFDVNPSEKGVFEGVGEKVNESWDTFFPKLESGSTTGTASPGTTPDPEMKVILSAPSEEVLAEDEDPYPALRVILGKPEGFEPAHVYPADVY